VKWGVAFPKTLKVKTGETVVFPTSSSNHALTRDSVNAKVMKDKRLTEMMMPARCHSTASGWSMADSKSSLTLNPKNKNQKRTGSINEARYDCCWDKKRRVHSDI